MEIRILGLQLGRISGAVKQLMTVSRGTGTKMQPKSGIPPFDLEADDPERGGRYWSKEVINLISTSVSLSCNGTAAIYQRCGLYHLRRQTLLCKSSAR